MTKILQKNETALKTSKNNQKTNLVKLNGTKNIKNNNVYYSTNDDPLFNKGFESYHVLQPCHVNGLNGFFDSFRVEVICGLLKKV